MYTPRVRTAVTPLLTAIALVAAPGWAQDRRSGVEGRTQPPLERPKLPAPVPPAPSFELPPVMPPARPPRRDAERVFVREIRLEGNTAISTADLEPIARRYEGRELSTEDLLDLRDRLTLAYIQRGFVSSGAFIPDQEIVDGVVTIRLVEGRLGPVEVIGLRRLRPGYIERRLRLGAGPPLNVNDLQEQLQLLLLEPTIERLNARLGPGPSPDQARLEVDVTEARPITISAGVANDRSPDIGAVRGELEVTLHSVLGYNDPVQLTLGASEGLKDGSLSYSVPLTARGLRFFALGEINQSAIVAEELEDLDVESRSRSLEAGLSQPVYETLDNTVGISLSLGRQHSETTLLGEPFSSVPGIEDGETDVSVLRFAQDWQQRGRERALALRSTFSVGLPILGATENDGDLPDGRFFAWLGQLEMATRLFATRQQLRLRSGLQLSADPLLPIEQYTIGGLETVRGYRENELVRDSGWSASLEYRLPLVRLELPGISDSPDDGWLELAPFVDAGGGSDVDQPETGQKVITSAGLGLRWTLTPGTLAELYWAHPFDDVDHPDDEDLQDHGIHFLVRVRLY